MKAIYRYPGVKPFESTDSALFFGRDRDRTDLLDLVKREQMVLLFGKSGYGKSSLVKAGLMPDLLANPQFRIDPDTGEEAAVHNCPIYIRFNLYGNAATSNSPCETVLQKLQEQAGSSANLPQVQAFLDQFIETPTLWKAFKSSELLAQKRIYLIFDQFEEFFSYPSEEQVRFRQQVSELLYTRIPQNVRDNMGDVDRAIKNHLHKPMEVHTLFSIRSDRMHLLNSMKEELPAILLKRYELKALTEIQAEAAIVRPALLEGEHFSLQKPFQYAPSALAKILSELSKAKSTNEIETEGKSQIEAFQLQMVCQTIEQKLIRQTKRSKNEQPTLVNDTDLPDFDQIYEQYYTDRLSDLPEASSRQTAHTLLEEEMVIGDELADMRRISIDKDLLRENLLNNHQLALGQDLLDYLENQFLIRRETINGRIHYEVSHDVLLAPLYKSRREHRQLAADQAAETQRLATEARALQAEQDAQRERKARELSEKQRRTARKFAITSVIGLMLALLLGMWAFYEKIKADEAKQLALDAQIEVILQRNAANEALKKVIATKKEKIKNQIDLDEKAQFFESAKRHYRVLAQVDSMEQANKPYNEILQTIEQNDPYND